jgi:hypothetical protein
VKPEVVVRRFTENKYRIPLLKSIGDLLVRPPQALKFDVDKSRIDTRREGCAVASIGQRWTQAIFPDFNHGGFGE